MGKTYQWNACDYARNSTAQQQWALELIEKLALVGDEVLLDIGCGDGKVSAELSKLLPRGRVVAMDSSAEMVALAQREYASDEYANLSFVEGDARRLEWVDEFDIAFSNATLHWVKDHSAVLQGIARGLKGGGRALLQMGGQGNAAAVVAVFDALIAQEQWAGYFADFVFPYGFYGPREYGVWLAEAGLKNERTQLIEKDMVHSNAAAFAGWVRTTWLPYIERVPEDVKEMLVGELVARYLAAHPPDEQGKTHVRMVRLEAALTKVG